MSDHCYICGSKSDLRDEGPGIFTCARCIGRRKEAQARSARDPCLVFLVAALYPQRTNDPRDRKSPETMGSIQRACVEEARALLAEIDRPAEPPTA